MGQTFAHILKSLRNERGLSQQALADQLGIKRSTIGNYEQGTRSPDMETLEAIAAHFEGKTFSDQAIDDIARFIDFVAMKEAQENGGRP